MRNDRLRQVQREVAKRDALLRTLERAVLSAAKKRRSLEGQNEERLALLAEDAAVDALLAEEGKA